MRLFKLPYIFFVLPLVASKYFEYVLRVKSPFSKNDTLVAHGKTEAYMFETVEMRLYKDWSSLPSCLDKNGKVWTELKEDMDCEEDRLWWSLSRLSFKGDSTHSRPYSVTIGDTTMMCNITVSVEEGEIYREGQWMIGWGLRQVDHESPVDIACQSITQTA